MVWRQWWRHHGWWRLFFLVVFWWRNFYKFKFNFANVNFLVIFFITSCVGLLLLWFFFLKNQFCFFSSPHSNFYASSVTTSTVLFSERKAVTKICMPKCRFKLQRTIRFISRERHHKIQPTIVWKWHSLTSATCVFFMWTQFRHCTPLKTELFGWMGL